MNCQRNCKNCGYWEEGWEDSSEWGKCGLANAACPPRTANGIFLRVRDYELLTREDFGCNQFRECLGHVFVRLAEELYRAVDEEYDDIARKPHGVAFAILTLLDGSGENWTGESRFRVCTEDEDGEWKPVEFQHHDLK